MQQSPLIAIGLPIALFIIMIGMGLTLTPNDFRREARAPKGLLIGSLLQLLALPLVGLALMGLPGLTASLAVGVVIVAACPGGTTSNLISFMARGNVALSIILTVIASLATIATLPFWVNLALDRTAVVDAAATTVHLPFLKTVAMLAVLILIPVSIGMIIRGRNSALAARADRAVSLFGAVVLAALIVGIATVNRDRLGTLLIQAGPACAALNVVGISLGLLGGRLARLNWQDSLTIAVELGIKNSTIGLLVAMTLLQNTEMAVPSAVYGIMMYGFGIGLIAFGKRLPAAAVTP
ncbi:bile acid:sodium symporter family protein [Flagellatimonas centrodinii]|uniref:bile acid:sodium symporter family protein n=1 Tax=Flagellatimonas centrodinii TaxID=2806210 RepID=UPI001FF89DA6|nr:bile acid:sodium symporter family protein [Flagellatimonas centrodinii]ULQ46332.1 bile acid:sodium symporter family protein [Flagellatimonas centrodinii]